MQLRESKEQSASCSSGNRQGESFADPFVGHAMDFIFYLTGNMCQKLFTMVELRVNDDLVGKEGTMEMERSV